MARNNKKKIPPGQGIGLGLATTVKVDPGPIPPRLAKRGLRQRISGVAQRFLPLKRPAVGLAPHHMNRPSPNPARYANMASNQSSKFTFKKFRFSIIFALLLGLAGAGGYAMMNALSKSFNKVTDLVDYKRWVKPSSSDSHYASNSRRDSKPNFFSGGNNDYQSKSSYRENSYRKGPSYKRSFRGGHKASKGQRFARQSKVRDPFYKEHHPLSKKHAVKHRKWSKKLAKIRQNSDRKFHNASYRSKRAKSKAK
jgi:hypothetical protein